MSITKKRTALLTAALLLLTSSQVYAANKMKDRV
jgi:carboxypeptidase C (cathepsin A)